MIADTSSALGRLHKAIMLASAGAIHDAITLLEKGGAPPPGDASKGDLVTPSDWAPLEVALARLLVAVRNSEDEKELVVGEVQMFQGELEETISLLDREIGERKRAQAELRVRNEHLRAVLNNIGEGLLTLDRSCSVAGETSASVASWFGPLGEGDCFVDYLARFAPNIASWFEVGWDQIAAGVLPVPAALAQLPRVLEHGGHHFNFSYVPIVRESDAAGVDQVLVVISDVTAAIEQKRLESRQRETLKLVHSVATDRKGFLEFFEEADHFVSQIGHRERVDDVELLRLVHTLKGNAMLFGIETIAEICHELESRLAEGIDEGARDLFAELTARWEELRATIEPLHETRLEQCVEVESEALIGALDDLVSGVDGRVVAAKLADWRLEPTRPRLQRFGEQAKRIARRLGKGDVECVVDDGGVRVCPERWGPFWGAFGHAVRNAVVHGLEDQAERKQAGKSKTGRIELRTYSAASRFVVEIRDDGRGIVWESVAERAKRLGLPCDSDDDLQDALFWQGLTTASSIDMGAGRGIGMSAIREVCDELGGKIELESARGSGTTFRFVFAEALMAPTLEEMVASHHVGSG